MTQILSDILKAAVLGVVEGFTEFLPISSTGHLIIVNQFLSFDREFTALFDIVIQLGAILAVIFYFRKKLWPFTGDPVKNKEVLNVWYKTIVAVLPALVLGALLGDIIEAKLFNPYVVSAALIIGGIIIIFIERDTFRDGQAKVSKINSVSGLGFKTAFLIGLIQCLAMIPGTSRSAATIIGAMLLGASRLVATEFSFFLAIPTMLAASAYSLLKHWSLLDAGQTLVLSAGFLTSFIVALIVIRFFINFVQKNSFKPFGYYRIVLGLLVLIYFWVLA